MNDAPGGELMPPDAEPDPMDTSHAGAASGASGASGASFGVSKPEAASLAATRPKLSVASSAFCTKDRLAQTSGAGKTSSQTQIKTSRSHEADLQNS
jgi:hypothetical protein